MGLVLDTLCEPGNCFKILFRRNIGIDQCGIETGILTGELFPKKRLSHKLHVLDSHFRTKGMALFSQKRLTR